ncbi:unknown [Dorea sp. CAG:317]|nr:unknown [Dorea sp. CAG:317]
MSCICPCFLNKDICFGMSIIDSCVELFGFSVKEGT